MSILKSNHLPQLEKKQHFSNRKYCYDINKNTKTKYIVFRRNVYYDSMNGKLFPQHLSMQIFFSPDLRQMRIFWEKSIFSKFSFGHVEISVLRTPAENFFAQSPKNN